jgi:hypothetical protein
VILEDRFDRVAGDAITSGRVPGQPPIASNAPIYRAIRPGRVFAQDGVNGELAGGMVMSLMTRRDSGIVIAITSNMAHANTSSLAGRVENAFAEQTR